MKYLYAGAFFGAIAMAIDAGNRGELDHSLGFIGAAMAWFILIMETKE